jgi:CheY-like chemotaxis protein
LVSPELTRAACLQEQAIDMVLTDYCMPEMTGYDLLKAIKVPKLFPHLSSEL